MMAAVERDFKNLISVIVPVYNAKDYLEKSVGSILAQTYEKLEVILVDDGSCDGSGQICDAIAESDPRVRVIHKDNGGQSDARNRGLDIASGDYIGFVDSDDMIDPRMYEILIENMRKEEAQISCCGTEHCWPDGKTEHLNDDVSLYRCFSRNEALVEFTNNRIITASLWDKLYHRSVFEELRLKKGIIYEDFQLMPYCLMKADRIVYTGQPLYFYNVTSVSSIRGHRSLKLYDIVPVCAELVELYEKVCPEGLPGMENQYIDHCLTLFYASAGDPVWDEKRSAILGILRGVDSKTFRDLYPDNRLKLRLVRTAPYLYVRVYGIVQKLKAGLNRI